MLKILMVFGVGFLEQLLYTKYLISVDKRQTIMSTLYMVIYMSLYLFIVSYAIKDDNTIPLLVAYALACGAGNFVIMKWENRNKNFPRTTKDIIKYVYTILNTEIK